MQVARDALIERILCALRTMHIGDLVSRALKWAYLPAAPILILWSIESWDHPLLAYVMQVRTGPLLDVANAISVLGNPTPYFLVAGLAFLIFKGAWPHPIKANRALFVLVAATAPALSTDLLKVAFARSRPSLFLEQGLYAFRFFHNAPEFASFPSEHATVVSAMAAALSVLFPAYRSTFFLLALVIAACRLVLAVHYLSDVLAGFVVGICFVVILQVAFTRFGWPVNAPPNSSFGRRTDFADERPRHSPHCAA